MKELQSYDCTYRAMLTMTVDPTLHNADQLKSPISLITASTTSSLSDSPSYRPKIQIWSQPVHMTTNRNLVCHFSSPVSGRLTPESIEPRSRVGDTDGIPGFPAARAQLFPPEWQRNHVLRILPF